MIRSQEEPLSVEQKKLKLESLHQPIRLKGTLLKTIDRSQEITLEEFRNNSAHLITYDHKAHKFYVLLLRSAIFAVVDCPVDMLPQVEALEDCDSATFSQVAEQFLAQMNLANSRRFSMPRSWSNWGSSLNQVIG